MYYQPLVTCKKFAKILTSKLSTLEQAKPYEDIATPPGQIFAYLISSMENERYFMLFSSTWVT